jgi:hypothetical protein
MVAVLDFLAIEALVAAINGHTVPLNRLQAIQSLRQSQGDCLKLAQFLPAEEIRMSQPPALQRSLEQLHARDMLFEIFERHRHLMFAKTL